MMKGKKLVTMMVWKADFNTWMLDIQEMAEMKSKQSEYIKFLGEVGYA